MEKKITRTIVCQALLDALGGGHYLEIGVNHGKSFISIRARRKWGVDPAYTFKRGRLIKYKLRSFLGLREERLFRLTSDEFFRGHGRWLSRRGVDVALVDGLHTYRQTLRDVTNILTCLQPGGAIVLHDCNPATELAAAPAASYEALAASRPGWCGDWNGDVWKVIVHLRSLRPDLETVVLDCDYGLGIVRRKPGACALSFSEPQIDAMSYADLAVDRQNLLGLKPPSCLAEIMDDCRKTRP